MIDTSNTIGTVIRVAGDGAAAAGLPINTTDSEVVAIPESRWDGTQWVQLTFEKRWDGTAWVDVGSTKEWDGTQWV